MSRTVFSSKNVRTVLLLIVALVVLAGWATTAHAQTSRDAQYGSPTASGEAAITASDLSGAEGSASAGSASAGSTGATGVLPATGGPLVQLVALGAIALSSTGLLILRQNSRR